MLKTYWKAKKVVVVGGWALSGYRTLTSEKRPSLVKLVIKGLFLLLFHAWGNDLASKL